MASGKMICSRVRALSCTAKVRNMMVCGIMVTKMAMGNCFSKVGAIIKEIFVKIRSMDMEFTIGKE